MKKLLVLTSRYPYPVIGGDKLRIYHVCKELKRAGFNLTLLSFTEDGQEKTIQRDDVFSKVVTVWLPWWQSYLNAALGFFSRKPLQVSYYHSRKMQRLINDTLANASYGGILAHLIRMAPYAVGAERSRSITKVIELTDAISLNYKRSREQGSRGLMGLIYKIEEGRVREYEKQCLEKFDAGVVVSRIDAEYLNRNTKNRYKGKLKVMGNGVMENFLITEEKERDPNLIIFEGNLRTHQNEDAVRYFVEEIYCPYIKKEAPETSFEIVGSSPTAYIMGLNGKYDIKVNADVPDVKYELEKAAVSVAPMRIGAGVQNKVLESMATGTAVVTTAVGAEGITGAKDAEHFVVRDNPQEFAKEVVSLMKDKNKRKVMGDAEKKLIQENYTFERQLAEYSELFT